MSRGRTARGQLAGHAAALRLVAEVGSAAADLVGDSVDDRLEALEEQEQVERLLAEIKARRRAE